MTNLLKVHEADETASEQATSTRLKLQEWADKHLPAVEQAKIPALDKDAIRDLRAAGVTAFCTMQETFASRSEWKPTSQFNALLHPFVASTQLMRDVHPRDVRPRELSHMLEGAVREFNKRFFQAGMQWNPQAEYLTLVGFNYPNRTSEVQDIVYGTRMGITGWASSGPKYAAMEFLEPIEGYYRPDWQTQFKVTKKALIGLEDWARGCILASTAWRAERFTPAVIQDSLGLSNTVLHIHYMEEDGPWIAGFLTPSDMMRLKFSRVRLGAYLAAEGLDDGTVRKHVEASKCSVASANFEALPNDVLWSDVYQEGPPSCMADSADRYETWDGIHPTDVYSSSYHGSGDNSLALIISRDASGKVDGRGILNLQRGTIVRWYGSPQAERALKRGGVDVADRCALQDSWLALIQREQRFIHPYTDGDIGYGYIDGNRVHITDVSDEPCLQDTNGSSYLGETYFCIDDEEYHSEEDAYYQPHHDTYIYDENPDWTCAVTGEFVRRHDRVDMRIYGNIVEVSDYCTVSRYQRQWLFPIGGDNWGIRDDCMRERFFEMYNVEEDDEDEDEDAA